MSAYLIMNLFLFLEIIGYIAIALMIIQIILTCGLTIMSFINQKQDEANESSNESFV